LRIILNGERNAKLFHVIEIDQHPTFEDLPIFLIFWAAQFLKFFSGLSKHLPQKIRLPIILKKNSQAV
jgi:hypothetical protein